jgi:hypothetical protein
VFLRCKSSSSSDEQKAAIGEGGIQMGQEAWRSADELLRGGMAWPMAAEL